MNQDSFGVFHLYTSIFIQFTGPYNIGSLLPFSNRPAQKATPILELVVKSGLILMARVAAVSTNHAAPTLSQDASMIGEKERMSFSWEAQIFDEKDENEWIR